MGRHKEPGRHPPKMHPGGTDSQDAWTMPDSKPKHGEGRGVGTGANSRGPDQRDAASGEATNGSVHAAKVAVQQPISNGVVMPSDTGGGYASDEDRPDDGGNTGARSLVETPTKKK